jgi:SRSO17 transposase
MTIPRTATPTLTFVDEYCSRYQDLFPDVRSYEQFKLLHVGLLADLPRKSLPAIAKAVGLPDAQALHHFLTASPWSADALRQQRLALTKQVVGDRPLTVCIDETGDRKKGTTTDYVARQYLGNVGKIDNGMVSVNLYGVVDNIPLPLTFSVFKPEKRLKPTDTYHSKPQIAIRLVRDLVAHGFTINVVVADALYGESGPLVSALDELRLPYVVAIRQNHGMLLPPGQRVRANRWRRFERHFTDGTSEVRWVREWMYGVRRRIRFFELTTDPTTLPLETTQFVMTNVAGNVWATVGNVYGLRTWIEYGFKQAKQALGWADYRLTEYAAIERWWELVMSAYLLVSMHALQWRVAQRDPTRAAPPSPTQHRWWTPGQNWAQVLTNLRLVLHPFVYFCWLLPWMQVLDLSQLRVGFEPLLAAMNQFHALLPL